MKKNLSHDERKALAKTFYAEHKDLKDKSKKIEADVAALKKK